MNIHYATHISNLNLGGFAQSVNASVGNLADSDKKTKQGDVFDLSELAKKMKPHLEKATAKGLDVNQFLEKSKIMDDIHEKTQSELKDQKISTQINKELALFKEEQSNKPVDTIESSAGLDSDYIDSIIKIGKKYAKPNEDIDDFRWGMLVKLGESMGIKDGAVIASLTDSDIAAFHNDFIKNKKFASAQAFWKDRFLTDNSGNFLKVNGKAVHNPDRPINSTLFLIDPDIVSKYKVDSDSLSTSALSVIDGEGRYRTGLNDDKFSPATKLINVRAEALMYLERAVTSGGELMLIHVTGSENKGLVYGMDDPNAEIAKAAREEMEQKLKFYNDLYEMNNSRNIKKFASNYTPLNIVV